MALPLNDWKTWPMNVVYAAVLTFMLIIPHPAAAQNAFCDSAIDNCRTLVAQLIQNEQVAIDVAMYYVKDKAVVDALAARMRAGVAVRVITDAKAMAKAGVAEAMARMAARGIPVRVPRTVWFHAKAMIFHGQATLLLGSANVERNAYQGYWQYLTQYPYLTNYRNENVEVNREAGVVGTARMWFDDWWTDDASYRDYANVTLPRWRLSPMVERDGRLLQLGGFIEYARRAIDAETLAIDANALRFESAALVDALIRAHQRGVVVRIDTEQSEYKRRPLHLASLKRMRAAGIAVRVRGHRGNNHAKYAVFYGQNRVVSGSANWSSGPNVELVHLSDFDSERTFYYSMRFARRHENRTGVIETIPFR